MLNVKVMLSSGSRLAVSFLLQNITIYYEYFVKCGESSTGGKSGKCNIFIFTVQFCVGVVVGGSATKPIFYGGTGGGIDIGSRGNDAVDVVVAVEKQWF